MQKSFDNYSAEDLLLIGANIIIKNNDIKLALSYFEEALKKSPDNQTAMHNCADLYNSLERYNDAEKLFSKLCKLDEKNGLNWYNLGISLISQNKIEEANNCIKKAYELNPELMNLSCGKSTINN